MDKYCSNCGAELNSEQDYCIKCGVKVNKQSDPFASDGDFNMVLFIVLLIVFWPAALIYYLVKKSK